MSPSSLASLLVLVLLGAGHRSLADTTWERLESFLSDYTGGARVPTIPAQANAALLGSVLTHLPAVPRQYTGACDVVYDPSIATKNKFALLLPPSTCDAVEPVLPPISDVWQVCSAQRSSVDSRRATIS